MLLTTLELTLVFAGCRGRVAGGECEGDGVQGSLQEHGAQAARLPEARGPHHTRGEWISWTHSIDSIKCLVVAFLHLPSNQLLEPAMRLWVSHSNICLCLNGYFPLYLSPSG